MGGLTKADSLVAISWREPDNDRLPHRPRERKGQEAPGPSSCPSSSKCVEKKFPEVWESELVLRGLGYSPDNTLRIWWLWVKKER